MFSRTKDLRLELKILSGEDPENLQRVIEIIRGGNPVALPTETVYGLAADASSPQAVDLIFKIKNRPANDPLIVHVANYEEIETLAFAPPFLGQLAEVFWPGPLTVILQKKANVSDRVTSGLPSVAVRIPAHPLFRQILEGVNRPLAAPSANPFGYISPTRAEHVVSSFGEASPWVLDGGPTEHGIESTILSLIDPTDPVILRLGPLSAEDLGEVLGCSPVVRSMPACPAVQVTPGSFPRHYSPNIPIQLHENIESIHHEIKSSGSPRNTGIILIRRPLLDEHWPTEAKLLWLSERGNLSEAASHLYEVLRLMDADPLLEIIHCQTPTGTGIGAAINDRLQRAAAQA